MQMPMGAASERRLQYLLHGSTAHWDCAALTRPLARLSKSVRERQEAFEAHSRRRIAVAFNGDEGTSLAAIDLLRNEILRLNHWTCELPTAAPVVAAKHELLEALSSREGLALSAADACEESARSSAAVHARVYADELSRIDGHATEARIALHDTNMRCAHCAQSALERSDAGAARLAHLSNSLRMQLSALTSHMESARAAERHREDVARSETLAMLAEWRAERDRTEHDDAEGRERRRRQVRTATRRLEARMVQRVRSVLPTRVAACDAEHAECSTALDSIEASLVAQERRREGIQTASRSRGHQDEQRLARLAALKRDVLKLLEACGDGLP